MSQENEPQHIGSQLLLTLGERYPRWSEELEGLLAMPLWMARGRLFEVATIISRTAREDEIKRWAERLAIATDPQPIATPFSKQLGELVDGLKAANHDDLARQIAAALAGSTGSEVRAVLTFVLSEIAKDGAVAVHLREIAVRLLPQTRLP